MPTELLFKLIAAAVLIVVIYYTFFRSMNSA